MDLNGSARPHLETLRPAGYVGVDIAPGPRVDVVCDAADLVERFGPEAFDVVVSTEMVEHVRDWRRAFDQMKEVLRPGGLLVVTTRSPGFKVHGYPYDFWRFTPDDMRVIFADFTELRVEDDEIGPGVFVVASKPDGWEPADLSAVALYSVVTKGKAIDVTDSEVARFKVLYHAHQAYRRVLPESVRAWIKRRL